MRDLSPHVSVAHLAFWNHSRLAVVEHLLQTRWLVAHHRSSEIAAQCNPLLELLAAKQQLAAHPSMRQCSRFNPVINGFLRDPEQDRRLIHVENIAIFDLSLGLDKRGLFRR